MATWAGDFSRKGPGLLLRDIRDDAGALGLGPVLAARPDVLLLTDFDFDAGLVALSALRDALADRGHRFDHLLALRPNTGMATGRDLDGDGLLGGPRDAQGYGWFAGQGGMAVLSRHPVAALADHSPILWQDAPDSRIAPDDPGIGIQRLASGGFWRVRVSLPGGPVDLLTVAATPPVFDGPEDRNGRRNADEVAFWTHRLPGLPEPPVILLGNLNLDPDRGEGLHEAVRAVLDHPRLADPLAGVPTVAWDSTGPMRVSYVLPDRALRVTGAGTEPAAPEAGPHALVWVDLAPPG